MRVVVGMGNPGAEYDHTRHNIGWLALDVLDLRVGAGRFRRERLAEVTEGRWSEEKVYLVKPLAYMNCSGQALASWLGMRKEIRDDLRDPPGKPEGGGAGSIPEGTASREEQADDSLCAWPRLLVLADDVNLPLGRIRIRPAGSAGGHNGLKDIERALGGRGYPRLRIGVGAPPGRMDRVDYVLGRFSGDEAEAAEAAANLAAAAVADWIALGMDAARNAYNGLRPAEPAGQGRGV